MRLQRYLAQCGVASRRGAEQLISAQRVLVNGQPAKIGDTIDELTDEVSLDGRVVRPERNAYVVLNKPRGVVTTARDTHSRKTVLDCLGDVGARLFPVGRLDLDVEGVLLFTNDGELAHRLMHPRYEVEKVYLVWVQGRVRPETAMRMEKGVVLDDGPTAPAKAVVLQIGARSTLLRLTLREGRNREVKRMCAKVGHRVRELQRISFAGIRVKGLKPGEWRYLTEQEIAALRKCVGLRS